METWECQHCHGHQEDAVLWDADRANKLILPLEACFQAALQLITDMGMNNPFPNLSAAVKAVQEVKREIMA